MQDFNHDLSINWSLEPNFGVCRRWQTAFGLLTRGYVVSCRVTRGFNLALSYARQQPRILFRETISLTFFFPLRVSLMFFFPLRDSPAFLYLEKSLRIFDDLLTSSLLLWQ